MSTNSSLSRTSQRVSTEDSSRCTEIRHVQNLTERVYKQRVDVYTAQLRNRTVIGHDVRSSIFPVVRHPRLDLSTKLSNWHIARHVESSEGSASCPLTNSTISSFENLTILPLLNVLGFTVATRPGRPFGHEDVCACIFTSVSTSLLYVAWDAKTLYLLDIALLKHTAWLLMDCWQIALWSSSSNPFLPNLCVFF